MSLKLNILDSESVVPFLMEELWLALLESDTLLLTNHCGVEMTHLVARQWWAPCLLALADQLVMAVSAGKRGVGQTRTIDINFS